MFGAWIDMWKNTFNFKGTAMRSEFWLAIIMNVISMFVFIIPYALILKLVTQNYVFPFILYMLLFTFPLISLYFRRARGVGLSTFSSVFHFFFPPILGYMIVGILPEINVKNNPYSIILKVISFFFSVPLYMIFINPIIGGTADPIIVISLLGLSIALIIGLFVPIGKSKSNAEKEYAQNYKAHFANESNKIIVNPEYLRALHRKGFGSKIAILSIFLFSLITMSAGAATGNRPGMAIICALIGIGALGLLLFFHFRSKNNLNRIISDGKFRLVKYILAGKQVEKDPHPEEVEDGYIYYLFFKPENTDPETFTVYPVTKKEYIKREVNDECYHLMVYNDKKGVYKKEDIFWLSDSVISPELEKYITTYDELSAANEVSAKK